jgi:hypothetical protein
MSTGELAGVQGRPRRTTGRGTKRVFNDLLDDLRAGFGR